MRKKDDEAIVEIPLSLLLSLIESNTVQGLDTDESDEITEINEEVEEQ